MILPPSYDSTGLTNLASEIENRLSGVAPGVGLDPSLGKAIPDGDTIVFVLFDGLGVDQLSHRKASSLRDSSVGTLQAGFPTTTSVSLATLATGLPPSQHGVISHLSWMPEHDRVVNTLKWVDLSGSQVSHDYATLLPRPNIWERLRAADIEPITIQPGDFSASPLTRVLYRGARFEAVWDVEDQIEATVQLAREPNRLIFTYVSYVDYAGHVFGLESEEFSDAMAQASRIWIELQRRLPPGTTLLGTSDHGLIDFDEKHKQLIRDPRFDSLRFAGDTRGLQLWCDDPTAEDLRDLTGGTLVDPMEFLGPDPSSVAKSRTGTHLLLAPEGIALLPRGFDKRLKAYHGGLDPREVEIPLLVG